MRDMFGEYKTKSLKIQNNHIGKPRLKEPLSLIIRLISNQNKINRGCLISVKELMVEMILFNK